jgi:hypothetical protein
MSNSKNIFILDEAEEDVNSSSKDDSETVKENNKEDEIEKKSETLNDTSSEESEEDEDEAKNEEDKSFINDSSEESESSSDSEEDQGLSIQNPTSTSLTDAEASWLDAFRKSDFCSFC